MFGLPSKAEDRYRPRLLFAVSVASLSSDSAAPTIKDVPVVGALEVQGDPAGVSYYVGGHPSAGGVGPFLTHRGDMIPAPPAGQLGLYQESGSGTLRVYHWAPEVAAVRLAAATAAAISGGSLSVQGSLTMAADDVASPSSLVGVKAYHMLYDAPNDEFDRWHGAPSNADANAAATKASHASVAARLFGLNPSSTWDRLRSFTPGDAIANAAVGVLGVVGFGHLWNATGSTWNRWHGAATNADAQGTNPGAELAAVHSRGFAFNGSTWDRIRTTGQTTGVLMPGYEFKKAFGAALDTSTTGAKLTSTLASGKDGQYWAATSLPAAGVTLELQLVDNGGGVVTLRTLTNASLAADLHAGPFSLQAGDALRWNVTVAAAGAVDVLISRRELR